MQVKPLFPSRSTIILPFASVSTILAAFATSVGPADIARAILTCVESSLPINEVRSDGVVCAAPRRSIPEMSSTAAVNVRKVRLSFVTFMGSFPALPKNAWLEIAPGPIFPFPFCFDVILIPLILATLFEPHPTEIDCDHQHFHNRPTIRSACIGAPLGWQTYAVRHHIIRSQLRRFKTPAIFTL